MDVEPVIEQQFIQVLGEILDLQEELSNEGLTVPGSKGQPIPNRLISELRAHRFLLLQMAGQLRRPDGDAEPARELDAVDRLRAEWQASR